MSRRLQLPIPRRQPWAARLTPRAHGAVDRVLGDALVLVGALGGRTSAARERHTSRTPRVQLAWESDTLTRWWSGWSAASQITRRRQLPALVAYRRQGHGDSVKDLETGHT